MVARDSSLVDIWFSPCIALAAIAGSQLGAGEGSRKLLLAVLASIWALRLGGYLLWRNWGREDPRYARFRKHLEDQGKNFALHSLLRITLYQRAIVFLALAENSLVGLCAGAAAGLGAWVWVRLFDAALLVGFFVPDLSPGAAVRLPAHFTALALAQGLCLALAATVTGSVLASWRLSNARPLGAFA